MNHLFTLALIFIAATFLVACWLACWQVIKAEAEDEFDRRRRNDLDDMPDFTDSGIANLDAHFDAHFDPRNN